VSTEAELLARIERDPDDVDARLLYADLLEPAADGRAQLIRIEEEMRALSPAKDDWWARRDERNRLRDAIDPAWRDLLGYGTRRDDSPLATWPADAKARWRILRAYVESWHGVRTGDVGRTCARLAKLGACGLALREWVVFLDDLGDDWQYVLRDSVTLEPVDEKRFSLLLQGEGDYHWTIAMKDRGKADPEVTGLTKSVEGNRSGKWVAARTRAQGTSPYGTFAHVTDFARQIIVCYADAFRPHPRITHAR
jgi:uncharacterized protein (TIGR02996 family)